MRTVFIVNPVAAGGRARRDWDTLQSDALRACPDASVVLSSAPGDAMTKARDACAQGASLIVAVGGDGTVNEVVNGLMDVDRACRSDVCLGVISVGTGRDLARTLGLPSNPHAQVARLTEGRERRLDLGRVTFAHGAGTAVRYFANVASFGLSGVVDRLMNRTRHRVLPAKLAFQVAVLRALVTYRNTPVRLRVDGGEWRTPTVWVTALCNGRYFGGGMRMAPNASPDDGLLDAIVIGDVSLATIVRRFGTVYRGEHLALPDVTSFRGRRIEAAASDAGVEVPLDIDGESIGRLPATFEVMPAAITVRC